MRKEEVSKVKEVRWEWSSCYKVVVVVVVGGKGGGLRVAGGHMCLCHITKGLLAGERTTKEQH